MQNQIKLKKTFKLKHVVVQNNLLFTYKVCKKLINTIYSK